MWSHIPIRWRLTLWYAILLGLALIMFGLGLYGILRVRLYQNLDEQLQSQVEVTQAAIEVIDGVPTLTTAGSVIQQDDRFVRLLSSNTSILLDNGEGFGGVPVDRDAVATAMSGETQYSLATVEEGDRLRILTVPVDVEGTPVGVLQVGLKRDEIDELLAILLGTLAFAVPLVLLVAGVGGYLLAGRALRPVATITALASRIGGEDLGARLDLQLPDDELGRLASTFDGMLARIEDAFERQRRFTSDAAHELRTPLTLIRSQVDLALARSRSPDAYREALQGVDGDLERLTGLVSKLLMVARADTGRMVLEQSEFDLAETISHVLDQYTYGAAESGVVVNDESSPTLYNGDEDLVVQVLVNLVDNALRHTGEGGTVSVGCAYGDDRQDVRLWVQDSGVGIAPEHQQRIFDRFYRVDSGRTREFGGAGLGLAICKAIAEAHGGEISLTSEPDRGTRVELRLPVEPNLSSE